MWKERDEATKLTIKLTIVLIFSRLLDLVAEDNAIEDTIYHLGRALNSERIDLASFLKVSTLHDQESNQT